MRAAIAAPFLPRIELVQISPRHAHRSASSRLSLIAGALLIVVLGACHRRAKPAPDAPAPAVSAARAAARMADSTTGANLTNLAAWVDSAAVALRRGASATRTDSLSRSAVEDSLEDRDRARKTTARRAARADSTKRKAARSDVRIPKRP
jgi:hypothetical protein